MRLFAFHFWLDQNISVYFEWNCANLGQTSDLMHILIAILRARFGF